jgi:hypothetical protein
MRGFEPEDVLEDPDNTDITVHDLGPFFYPSDEEIESVGVRGIYLSNFMSWNARKQTEFVIERYGFETALSRERTFNVYDKLDDIHANGTHDYLKYLKFGYGRATDDASTEVRHRRMSREEAIRMVAMYDPKRPSDLDIFLKFVGITEQEFEDSVERFRDKRIWEKKDGVWKVKDSIANHVHDKGSEEAKLELIKDKQPFIKGANRPKDYPRNDEIPEDKEYVIL